MGVCWAQGGGGGGVTTHTRVSGEMVKPSMYNCLTLIKGGYERGEGWISRGQESCLKAWRGAWGSGLLQVVLEMHICEPYLVRARLYALTAAAENTWQM